MLTTLATWFAVWLVAMLVIVPVLKLVQWSCER